MQANTVPDAPRPSNRVRPRASVSNLTSAMSNIHGPRRSSRFTPAGSAATTRASSPPAAPAAAAIVLVYAHGHWQCQVTGGRDGRDSGCNQAAHLWRATRQAAAALHSETPRPEMARGTRHARTPFADDHIFPRLPQQRCGWRSRGKLCLVALTAHHVVINSRQAAGSAAGLQLEPGVAATPDRVDFVQLDGPVDGSSNSYQQLSDNGTTAAVAAIRTRI